jgi:hypothetical protein
MNEKKKIPVVDLLDVNIEPSDEELEALMHAAGDHARANQRRCKEIILDRLLQNRSDNSALR